MHDSDEEQRGDATKAAVTSTASYSTNSESTERDHVAELVQFIKYESSFDATKDLDKSDVLEHTRVNIWGIIYHATGYHPTTPGFLHRSDYIPVLPPLRQPGAEFLLFYFRELYPYLLRPDLAHTRSRDFEELLKTANSGTSVSHVAILIPEWSNGSDMLRLWRAGLVRSTRLELIKSLYSATMIQARVLMSRNAGVEEITEQMWVSCDIARFLLAQKKFRSERSELLVLKTLMNRKSSGLS
ncbi:hypothetical protein BJ508DRAFT_336394 [Ascobolus immersus RN42]|uniref:Uncharacterized protein n=1 Tax=Ascobolus immersus RN42 TaxID=1160509 RepID=A0A3N4H8Q4_ASCIM|nr:hypothetical protein BJ508DRAFT_336394 [Ascobolus immersus RN42]